MRRSQIYNQISLKRGRGVRIDPSLCFYSTSEVLRSLKRNPKITSWLKFISNHYIPEAHDVLLIYPCSADKPYNKSRSYTQLYATLSRLGEDRKRVHVVTVSEPFGLVPEEFYGKKTRWHDWRNDWYDCPGLFEWWCKKHGTYYSEEEAEESIQILASYVALFLRKVESRRRYKRIVAFVRTLSADLKKTRDQTHRRILEQAAGMSGVKVQLMPGRKLISRIVNESGPFAWDMYGVAHPKAQDYLYKQLRLILNG
jgi:archaeosine synthase